MRRTRLCLLCIAILTLCISAFPLETRADDSLIIPGERIGDISLTMSMDDVLKTLGPPSQVQRLDESVRYDWGNKQIRVVQSLDTGVIVSVRTYWVVRAAKSGGSTLVPNPYRTEKGIGIGATPEQVRRAYGDAGCFTKEFSSPRGKSREFLWFEMGITFLVATDPLSPSEIRDKVREIGVRRKGGRGRGPGEGYTQCT